MKATKVKSFSSPIKRTSTKITFSVKENSAIGTPTPKDFDSFIPWVCVQFQVPRIVTVQRLNQEEYRPRIRRLSATRSKLQSASIKKQPESPDSHTGKDGSLSIDISSSTDTKNAIHMTTYYNTKGHLVEVAFINSPCNIHRKVVRAINLCLPFHPLFHRLIIKGGGLTSTVLYEVGKLLPFSNITDVYLDNNYVTEGNYHVLLEKESKLQNLSLRCCKINDDICKEIASKLDYGAHASKSLLTLDLTSNQITDLGAQALSKMLRRNRILLHLSLADNKITDTGALNILNNLLSFPLNDDDIYDLKQRYIKYCFKKVETYRQCREEIISRLQEKEEKERRGRMKKLTEVSKDEDKENRVQNRRLTEISKRDHKDYPTQSRRSTVISKFKGTRKPYKHGTFWFFEKQSVIDQIEKMAKEIVGEFIDIFDDQNVRYKRGQMYAIGNLKLCSLNLAYNDLSYFSVRKLYEILKYQRELTKPPQCKGLLRVVLDGNNIPNNCVELEAIESYLDIAVSESKSTFDLRRCASSIKSSKKLHHNK